MPKLTERNASWGFTMVELILVMSIIAVLATAFTLNYTGSQKRARDTQRRSDLKQYQIALEKYANSNSGFYPLRDGTPVLPSTLCVAPLSVLNCTSDPKLGTNSCSGGACKYQYLSNTAGANATEYALWARLENPHDTSKPIFVVCSGGVSRDVGSIPSFPGNPCPS